jgi:hypothetical protein
MCTSSNGLRASQVAVGQGQGHSPDTNEYGRAIWTVNAVNHDGVTFRRFGRPNFTRRVNAAARRGLYSKRRWNFGSHLDTVKTFGGRGYDVSRSCVDCRRRGDQFRRSGEAALPAGRDLLSLETCVPCEKKWRSIEGFIIIGIISRSRRPGPPSVARVPGCVWPHRRRQFLYLPFAPRALARLPLRRETRMITALDPSYCPRQKPRHDRYRPMVHWYG